MISDADLYDDQYFLTRAYGLDEKRKAMYEQERKRIYARLEGMGGSVLDVGCGTGDFLATFDDRWERYGIEPSDYASDKARQKGIQIERDLNAMDSESMDVVIFRGTLQHINYPTEDLFQAVRVLKEGGLLVILATPDADSLVYHLFGNLPALDLPRNWVIFGHRCLSNILKRLNCGSIEILYPYWRTPYANPIMDFTKFLFSLFFGYHPFAFPGNMMEMYAVKNSSFRNADWR